MMHLSLSHPIDALTLVKGGSGSGNFGHAGRPGEVGGSAPAGTTAPAVVQESGLPHAAPQAIATARAYARETARYVAEDASEVEQRAVQFVSDTVAEYPLSIRVWPQGLHGVLRDGRFKSQFETNTSNGAFSLDARVEAEQKGMGIDPDIDPKQRPIYAYFDHPDSEVGEYGNIQFVLKDEVKRRATVTMGDSLDEFLLGNVVASPAMKPDISSIGGLVGSAYNRKIESYLEAQIHGGVTLQDVDRVIVYRKKNNGAIDDYWAHTIREVGLKVELK